MVRDSLRRWPSSMLLAVVSAALVAAAAAPAVGQELEERIERAEERTRKVRGDLDDAVARYEQVRAQLAELRDEQHRLAGRASRLRAELDDARAALTDRAVAMFKRGRTDTSMLLFAAEGAGDAADRVALLSALQTRDRVRAERAEALRTALAQTEQLAAARAVQLSELEEELVGRRDALTEELEHAEVETVQLRRRARNRRPVDRGPQQGVYSCIFEPGRGSFRDTWGDPRSGGRSHKGTDVFAVMGEPVLAFTDGTIARHSDGGLGGISVYLQGDDGNLYYYTHLRSIDPAAAVGRRVEAGETIAANGDSGNARGGAPHVHFEVKPGGGASVNPYPWLAAACH